MSETSSLRIKFAYFSPEAEFLEVGRVDAISRSKKITTKEYSSEMSGAIYCPGCYEKLTKVPKDKEKFANGRNACFAHFPSLKPVPCDLRSTTPSGLRYETEEEARLAIEKKELVIVSSFMGLPQVPIGVGEYDQSQVEDLNGPLANVSIARHTGKEFNLPSTISSVESLCRLFDINLYRYYLFPGSNQAYRLVDSLVDIRDVQSIDSVPKLYFGKIIASENAGITPKPDNIRMTKLECNSEVRDFTIKVVDYLQAEKGINDGSVGRYIIFWAKIEKSGIGLAASRLRWGEFALLPEKYEKYLPS